jgi:Raf kinase inhibitor-like YbhB/YbcL family protein
MCSPFSFVFILVAVTAIGHAGSAATKNPIARISLTSSAFKDGEPIPKVYTGEGHDTSPPLKWGKLPARARELALVCEDPDAPTSTPWVHWVLYRIAPSIRQIGEAIPPEKGTLDVELSGAFQGYNSWNLLGYKGPMPPLGHGWHHYQFKLYALDEPIKLPAEAHRDDLMAALRSHIIGEGTLVGTYHRN